MPHSIDPLSTSPPSASPRWPARLGLVCVAAGVVCVAIAVQWTGEFGGTRLDGFARETTGSGVLALAWLLMALGVGWPIQRAVAPRTSAPMALRLGLGICVALALMTLIGSIGWGLGSGSRGVERTLATAVLLVGAVGGAFQLMTMLAARSRAAHISVASRGPWLGVALAAPAVAVLAVASSSAPGWLWATEFGGYDALSYHLQMPREWMALGRIIPLEHCVYAAMPNAVEAAFLHLMIVRGDPLAAGVACQFLHGGFAIATALLSGSAARIWARRMGLDVHASDLAAAIATALVLATPWTIVVGSLAYSEMGVTVAFATGLLVLGDRSIAPIRAGGAAGLCVAVASAAKLSAVGMVGVPLALVALMALPRRTWLAAGAVGALLAVAVLAPWLVRNWIVCGSPTFPFLPALFGAAWWSTEQMDVWTRAHHGGSGVVRSWLRSPWSQWLAFGFGSPPQPGEPWRTQWALLPWLGVAGLVLLAGTRRPAALAFAAATIGVPLLFWIVATHTQSRFLVPTVVPLSMLAAIATAAATGRCGAIGAVAQIGAAVLAFWPIALFHGERDGAPAAAIGAAAHFTGDALRAEWTEAQRSAVQRQAFLDGVPPAFWINHGLDPTARVLLLGHAIPWYLGQGETGEPASFRWQTVWDADPLSRVIAEDPAKHHESAAPEIADRWRRALRDRGFTHVLVDLPMLDRWRSSGWLDPNLSAANVDALIGSASRPMATTAHGIVLIDLAAE